MKSATVAVFALGGLLVYFLMQQREQRAQREPVLVREVPLQQPPIVPACAPGAEPVKGWDGEWHCLSVGSMS